MQTVIIMQGVPGAGKSTLAHTLAGPDGIFEIVSADDFFWRDGKYCFDAFKLREAHQHCFSEFERLVKMGCWVIVDNTNIRSWEAKKYVALSHSLGAKIIFLRVEGGFQNVHGVPEEKVKRMHEQMENLTLTSVLTAEPPY